MRVFLLSALSVMAAACASLPPAAAPSPKAFVIRHFEKAAGSDPALTAAREANALRLAERLAGERIVAVYSTDTRRTRSTALPTATKNGLTVSLYAPADEAALIERALQQPGSVLIVGHSNTVPSIVGRLSGVAQPAMDESQFGTLFVIDLRTRAVAVERIGG